MNLTGITDPQGVYFKHFYDSIYPLTIKKIQTNVRILDIGPGAGFPSIPLKIYNDKFAFTLIETLNKRVQFLNNLSSLLELNDVKCVHGRAEDLAHLQEYRGSFDFVIVRAVSNLSTLIEVCTPFLKKNGQLLCLKGPDVTDEINDAKIALRNLNAQVLDVHSYQLPFDLGGRTMISIGKTADTPKQYPRKQGLPFKKPLI
jgi:16S rRNA (guanine527-N7)-methyltransferase